MTELPKSEDLIRLAEPLGRYAQELLQWRYSWLETARPKQLPPAGDWRVWANIAGRGWGKTRVGAEDSGYFAASTPGARVAVVAPTQNDCRSVCFEGESGLLEVIPPYFIAKNGYNRSLLELQLVNGSMLAGRSAEKPDRLRGPQWHRAWCDELASWGATAGAKGAKRESARLQDTWDNLIFGLRLGHDPKTVVTTTPRPLQFLRDMVANEKTVLSKGSTFENKRNLAASALSTFRDVYDGTSRGAQELYAEILDDVEGALWTLGMIEAFRVDEIPPGVELTKIVVAVDPAITSEASSDEWGIIAAGLGTDGCVYILDDVSTRASPATAAQAILLAYDRHDADFVVAEVNQGGDLVEYTIRAEDPDRYFSYRSVRAKRGKYLRAEPVAAYYEKGKVRHVGYYPKLEKQMVQFVGSTGNGSPDRLDALVYAVTELMTGTPLHDFF